MANKLDRRKFLQLSALSTPLLLSKKAVAKQITYSNSPIVISTWDSGMEVNAAAWKILSAKGRALDAIEAGATGYKDYLSKYAASSRGIERLEAAQEFKGKVLSTTPDPSRINDYLISQPKFLNAIRAAEKETNLSTTQLAVLKRVAEDLDSGVLARAPKSMGSDTVKNMSTANVIGGMIGKQMFGDVPLALQKVSAPMNWLYNGTDDAIRELLVNAMLDPKLAASLMKKATTTTVEPLSKELQRKALQLGYGATFGLIEKPTKIDLTGMANAN